jgi:subtilase-type serine protease
VLDERNALVPALRVDYTRLRSQAYTETGAGALDLDVGAQTSRALVVGVDGRYIHLWGEHSRIDAGIGVGYDTINDQGDISAAYAGTPNRSFTAAGIGRSPWILRGGVGYTYLSGRGVDVSLRYEAEGRSGYLNQVASIKAAWTF